MSSLAETNRLLIEILKELQAGRRLSEEVIKANTEHSLRAEGELKGLINAMLAQGQRPEHKKCSKEGLING